jgi:hypothetical protein
MCCTEVAAGVFLTFLNRGLRRHRFGPRADAAVTGRVGHELVTGNAGDNGIALLWVIGME